MKNNKKIDKLKITFGANKGIEAEGLPETSLLILVIVVVVLVLLFKVF